MKINKIIQKRCSTRTFLDKPVPQKAINTIIDAGRLAPSTKNSQPWLYIQLNTQQKDSVVQELIRVAKSNDAPLCALMTATAEAMRQAPVLILVFFTKNDDMDLSPLADMWKSDEYRFAEFLLTTLKKDSEKEALQACIDAIPTDGLGITSSDLEQIGCKSYFDVDDILKTLIPLEEKKECGIKEFDEKWKELEIKYGVMEVQKVWERHINSEFKRKGRKTLKIYTNRF